MVIVGVRFKDVGKIYYFDPGELDIPRETAVIVETARGVEYGLAVLPNRSVKEEEILQPLKKVIRVATAEDTLQETNNRKREEEARIIFLEKSKARGLGMMNLVDVELTFDLNKIFFYFTADGRVDFRELVKDLVSVFRMRIELRQIGVRDEAKVISGIGICGRTLCCATFLDEFQPVSIKMAKEQGMALNPSKISGICSKLMCCLRYEEETYEFLNRGLPGAGDLVRTPDGDGEVISVNVLRQFVKVSVQKKKQDEPAVSVYSVDKITILERRPPMEHGEDCKRRGTAQACPGCPERE